MPRFVVGLLGVAWLVLFAVGGPALQGRPPSFDIPVADLRATFQAHGTRYLAGDFVAGCGFALCLVPFAGFLPSALLERPHPAWSRLLCAAAVGLTATGAAATSFLDAVALAHGGAALDDATLTGLVFANAAGIAAIGLPAAVFATAAAALLWQSGARGLAAAGALCAPLLVAGAAFPLGAPDGPLWTVRFAGFAALAVFVLAVSVRLMTRRRPPPAQR
jgi:hypothetical protein